MNQAQSVNQASKGGFRRIPASNNDSPTLNEGRAVVMFASSERLEMMLRAEGFWVFNV